MDNSIQRSELIMRYLDDEMSSAEKEEFEKNLSSDEGMLHELENLKMAKNAVRVFGLKQQVAFARDQMRQEKKPQAIVRKMNRGRRIARYSLTAAASILVIGICILAYNFFNLSADKLYREKYNSFELSTLRGGNESPVSDIEKAYRKKNYNEVIANSKQRDLGPKDKFLAGISYLELNSPAEAVNLLNEVIASNRGSDHPVYKDETEYYLALSYLKIKNYDQALQLMNAIHENPSHLYQEKFTKGFILKVKMLKMR